MSFSLGPAAFRLAAMLISAAPSGAPSAAPAQSATVVFGGDLVPHGQVLHSAARHGWSSLFAPVAPVLRAADLALVNFETPAAPSRPESPNGVWFNVHEDFVRAVVDAGIDVAAIANNHSYDTGARGVEETVRTLRSVGLRVAGGALGNEDPLEPQRFTIAGGTLCVFAATRIVNFEMSFPGPGRARIGMARPEPVAEQEALLANVQHYRSSCGAILVSLHSGFEYQNRPEPRDRVYFRRLADAGADVVIAHHSHTVQPVELYSTGGRHVPIFYSLGNMISNQGFGADAEASIPSDGQTHISIDPRLREGILAVMRFENAGSGRLRIAEFGYVPLWTINTFMSARSGIALIQASLMPRDGGGDRMLHGLWQTLVHRTGEEYLLPESSLPGAADGYRASNEAVLANRRGTRH
jgi:poly-gamma-glutamate synthesis protein (capsule biosynthesis protein)